MEYCTISVIVTIGNHRSVVLSWQHFFMPTATVLETVCRQILYFELVFIVSNNLTYFISCSHQFMQFWTAIYGLKELISFVTSGSLSQDCYLNLSPHVYMITIMKEIFSCLAYCLLPSQIPVWQSVTIVCRNQKIIPSCISSISVHCITELWLKSRAHMYLYTH